MDVCVGVAAANPHFTFTADISNEIFIYVIEFLCVCECVRSQKKSKFNILSDVGVENLLSPSVNVRHILAEARTFAVY